MPCTCDRFSAWNAASSRRSTLSRAAPSLGFAAPPLRPPPLPSSTRRTCLPGFVRAIQVDGGSEFMTRFERACQDRSNARARIGRSRAPCCHCVVPNSMVALSVSRGRFVGNSGSAITAISIFPVSDGLCVTEKLRIVTSARTNHSSTSPFFDHSAGLPVVHAPNSRIDSMHRVCEDNVEESFNQIRDWPRDSELPDMERVSTRSPSVAPFDGILERRRALRDPGDTIGGVAKENSNSSDCLCVSTA
jgi:hypothetical protein